MSNFSLFDSDEIFNIFFDYIKNKYEFKDLGNRFIIRKIGRIKRLHYAIDDLVDWWDLDIKKDELEYMLKNEIYTKAVFKNILEFSNIKQVLDNLSMKPKKVSYSKVYYISFEDIKDEKDLYKSLSYNQKKNIRNYLNRLRKINFVFEKMEDYKSIFKEVVNFITLRHKETYWNDLLYVQTIDKVLNFFHNNNMMEVFVMKSQNDIMIINITLLFEKKSFGWIIAFNDKYAHFSPPRISVWYILNYYLKKEFKEFNFMRGEAEYKTFWTKKYYKLYRYEFENPNLIRKVFSFFILNI